MRSFDHAEEYAGLLTPDIVALLTQIHEYKGAQNSFLKSREGDLTLLRETAGIQSVETSNALAGLSTSDARLKKLVLGKTLPRTQAEEALAGYRDVLFAIQENYAYLPVRAQTILQLHRDLYRYSGKSVGGSYRASDSVTKGGGGTDNRSEGLPLLSAQEVPEAMDSLCGALEAEQRRENADALLLMPMFVLDFLCIRPFSDGNARLSRLLTLLLLCRAGCFVGKYVSIEKLLEESKEEYREALLQSAIGWQDGRNDCAPFARYMLGVVCAACREFSVHMEALEGEKRSKPERIAALIRETGGVITKSEIMARSPDIAQATVQRTLIELQRNGSIIKIGGGRYTSYTWNWEKKT